MTSKWYGKAAQVAAAGALILALAACGGKKDTAPSPAPSVGTSPVAGATPGAGQTSPGAASPAGTPGAAAGGQVNAAAAEALFKANCVACHGEKMDGNGAANRNLTKVGSRYSAEQILGIITNGRNGMPAFKGRLKDDELHTLSNWLATMK